MRRYAVELIGTFFLVFTVGMTVIGHKPGDGVIPEVAIGVSLMVMIFAGGHISGGHYNPAVTLGAFLRGKFDWKDVIPYWIAQVAGGALAAAAALYLKGNGGTGAVPDIPKWFLAEFLGTFALVFTMLNTATAKGTAGNSFYGLAIGLSVTFMAFAVGGMTGGAFNPAVAIGMTMMGLIKLSAVWIHLVADLLGGVVAAIAFRATCWEEPDVPVRATNN